MDRLSRRSFFKIAGAAVASTTVDATAATRAQNNAGTIGTAYTFFNADEAKFIEAAVERLIPPDENGPGAREAAVPNFIDKQLGGAWGAGERLYRAGPWQDGTPSQGYQMSFTPAELFRHSVRGIRADFRKRGGPAFERLSGKEQDAYLKLLEGGKVDLDGVPSKVFFESLLSLAIQGYFADPVYGGNKDMASWKMIGFPGAYATYYDLVDKHGMLFTRKPMSIGEDRSGVIHIHPAAPAAPAQGKK